MESYTRKTINIALLISLVLVSHLGYVYRSNQYPQWDEHNYLSLAIKYLDIINTPSWDTYGRMLHVTGYLQPLYSFFVSLPLLVLGTSHTYIIAQTLNGLFFALSTVGVYALTGKLLAAIVFFCLGNVQFYSHFTYTETAVTMFVVWSIVYLARSKGFTDRTSSLLAGAFVAMATLTRWIAPVFVVGPALIVVSQGIRRERKIVIANIVLFFLTGIGLPSVLYFFPNWSEFAGYVSRNQNEGAQWVARYRFAEMANTFSTRSIMYYFNILSQNTILIFLLFTAGLLYCLWHVRKYMVFLAGFFVPYMFLTFVAVWKEDRFLVPLYPVFAAIIVTPVTAISKGVLRFSLVTLLLVVSILNYFGGTWGIGPMGKRGLVDIVLPSFIHHPRRIYLTPLVWPPAKELTNAHQIADVIEAHTWQGRIPVVLGAFTFEPLDTALKSILWYHKRTLMDYKNLPWGGHADFIITKSNDVEIEKIVRAGAISSYAPIANIPVPMDNSTVTIFQYDAQ